MANLPAETADQVIKFTLYNVAVASFKGYLRAYASWLNLPVISQLFDFIVGTITDKFFYFLSQVMTFAVIDIQVGAELEAYKKAEAGFRAVYKSGNQEAIDAARKNFGLAARDLVRFRVPNKPA